VGARNPHAEEVTIFDMETGRDFYGPGGPYHVFAGRDASMGLAKMSTDVQDLEGDFSTLSISEIDVLLSWYNKFQQKYIPVGYLVMHPAEEDSKVTKEAASSVTTEDSGVRRRNG